MSPNNWGRLRLDCENVFGSTLDPNCMWYDSAGSVKIFYWSWIKAGIFVFVTFFTISIFLLKVLLLCLKS